MGIRRPFIGVESDKSWKCNEYAHSSLPTCLKLSKLKQESSSLKIIITVMSSTIGLESEDSIVLRSNVHF